MSAQPQYGSTSVAVGVDTHLDCHVAVALDNLGRRLGELTITTDVAGYERLLRWVSTLGEEAAFGVEGTASFGVGLCRYLQQHGQRVLEVSRPNRQRRRLHGKSDPVDAENAARAVLANDTSGQPKGSDGTVEMIRTLRIARRSANQQRTSAINQLRAVVVTAPDELRQQLRTLTTRRLIDAAARLRPGALTDPASAAKTALRSLARRIRHLDAEIADLDSHIEPLVRDAAPALLAIRGVGVQTAATLLIAAGDNRTRLRHERAFARLCGVAPVDASSGRQQRHRLSRAGNRDANSALHMIVCSRLAYEPRTRAYLNRRLAEGKTRREALRCLKRYLARELYPHLVAALP